MNTKTKKFVDSLPRQNYIIYFSNGQTLMICEKSFKQILQQYEDNQDIMLLTQDNSMINLNQICSISPLEEK